MEPEECPHCGVNDYEAGYCATCEYEGKRKSHCERCGKMAHCEAIPMMGYSEYLCRSCTAAAYRSAQAI